MTNSKVKPQRMKEIRCQIKEGSDSQNVTSFKDGGLVSFGHVKVRKFFTASLWLGRIKVNIDGEFPTKSQAVNKVVMACDTLDAVPRFI